MKKHEKSVRPFKNRLRAAAIGTFAAFSVATASLFSSPEDVVLGSQANAPAPVVQSASAAALHASVLDAPKRAERIRVRVRGAFYRSSPIVRGVVLLPFWAVGKAILCAISMVVGAIAPVWDILLGLLLNALLFAGVFIALYKLFFPNGSLKKLLTRRNIVLLGVGSIALSILDAALRLFWEDYRPISIAIRLAAGLIALSIFSCFLFGKRGTRVFQQPACRQSAA